LRNVFFGTSEFAAVVLDALLDVPGPPALVVTRPARCKGRGRKPQQPPVALLAQEAGLPLLQPDDINASDSVARIKDANPDVLTVCAYGAVVKEPLLSLAPSFNVHPSLLPRWRGAAPIERAIQAGDEQTGVSIMRLVEELDAGPVCAQQEIAIGEWDDYGSIAPRLAKLGGELLVVALMRHRRGELGWQEQLDGQSPDEVTYAEKITRVDRLLDPRTEDATALARTVRALTPHIGAFLELETGEVLRVLAASPAEQHLLPGTVRAENGKLYVGTIDAALELHRVQPAGGTAMDVESFLRGNEPPRLA
jgi:methionyl-tRNA formyltransferase